MSNPPPNARATASPDDVELAALCKALGHPVRVQILRHILLHDACFFGNLADFLPLAPSTVSQHLSVLKKAGLVEEKQQGDRRTAYCLNTEKLDRMTRAVAEIRALCCGKGETPA